MTSWSPRPLVVGVAACLLAACAGDVPLEPEPAAPVVGAVAVAANPHNALSGIVTFGVTGADSARVVYQAQGEQAAATPYYRVVDGSATIVTLGLVAGTPYTHSVELLGPGGRAASDPVVFQTGALPDPLPTVQFQIAGTATPGYTLIGLRVGGYIVAIDQSGRIIWYRQLDGYEGAAVTQQPNGHLTVFIGETSGWQPTYGYYTELTADGIEVGRYAAPPAFYTDNHEILLTEDDPAGSTAHLFSYDLRPTDLSRFGGPTDALLAGHQIMRLVPGGTVEFMWNAWDHFSIDDWIEEPASRRTQQNVDFDHPNSLDIGPDGHYVASFRDLAEVTKLDARTGNFIWRFGGNNNQFAIINDPLGGFNGQHSVRVLQDGNLLLYDNGLRHTPPETRAVEYRLDLTAMTATLVWQYRHSPPIYTPFLGSVQRLASGNTFIGFGGVGIVVEADAAGAMVWQGTLTIGGAPGVFYRAHKIGSLYRFEVP